MKNKSSERFAPGLPGVVGLGLAALMGLRVMLLSIQSTGGAR